MSKFYHGKVVEHTDTSLFALRDSVEGRILPTRYESLGEAEIACMNANSLIKYADYSIVHYEVVLIEKILEVTVIEGGLRHKGKSA